MDAFSGYGQRFVAGVRRNSLKPLQCRQHAPIAGEGRLGGSDRLFHICGVHDMCSQEIGEAEVLLTRAEGESHGLWRHPAEVEIRDVPHGRGRECDIDGEALAIGLCRVKLREQRRPVAVIVWTQAFLRGALEEQDQRPSLGSQPGVVQPSGLAVAGRIEFFHLPAELWQRAELALGRGDPLLQEWLRGDRGGCLRRGVQRTDAGKYEKNQPGFAFEDVVHSIATWDAV